MGELSKRMMVTGGNITGITDQLEQEELVVRVADHKDRRAYSVKLTPAGRKAFERMASVHEAWVDELFANVEPDQKSVMMKTLAQLKSQFVSDNEDEQGSATA